MLEILMETEKAVMVKNKYNLNVQVLDNFEKAIITKGRKAHTRKLYPRKTGILAGSYLFNLNTNIYKFSQVNENNEAQDVECIGNYEKGITFEKAIEKIEKEQEEKATNEDGYVVHKEFETIKACVENDIPVYLVGPAGSGMRCDFGRHQCRCRCQKQRTLCQTQ